ncbi:hypothetical protein PENSUB_842 [Penicillium subrubescens]|uniref:Uncharacterized protein n=1 Tax=Penicillium subrubescens TaxID=1316194 RepID=A0A1Q5UMG3_9EURO|nr:hypothetical protein PENSUB_842 [Penicillium subrubescens]
MSLIITNTGGSTKRSVGSGMPFVTYCTSEAPRYTPGTRAMLVACCIEISLLLAFAAHAAMLNKIKDKILREQRLSLEEAIHQFVEEAPVDQTVKEDIFFRYSYWFDI